MKRSQPSWCPPIAGSRKSLSLYNSLTRKKEPFRPQNGQRVLWYICGPTVYDASHMGHARSYISFDIVRRVMSDYFNYDIFHCMNITDIDDKIIVRARQTHLLEQYAERCISLTCLISDIEEALSQLETKLVSETDKDILSMLTNLSNEVKDAINVPESHLANDGKSDLIEHLLSVSHDVLMPWLDDKFGSTIIDNSIFSDLPRKWEEEFHKDMKSLNVRPPDILTRVSEYIPEIIAHIQKIFDNGYAYRAHGSVYFDVSCFDSDEHHFYGKLVPEAYGSNIALANGEGELSSDVIGEKRSANDFALWKASKPGEPAWPSPWGLGRPGWHIECSAMASCIFGESMDIHCGGSDLKFPHHDNELAQAEACFQSDHWVHYFLHTGHLMIEGCKMSKSLKNFITINNALKQYTSSQIRILFLLHSWKDTLDYGVRTVEVAVEYEKYLMEFFGSVKDALRSFNKNEIYAWQKWQECEVTLNLKLLQCKQDVHDALCDSIDTRTTLEAIRNLVSAGNTYIAHSRAKKYNVNHQLMKNVAMYITKMLHIFGVLFKNDLLGFPTTAAANVDANVEEIVMPYLSAFSQFRHEIRQTARATQANAILQQCDWVRDEILPILGVRLEDIEGCASVIKMADPNILLKERHEKQQLEELHRCEKNFMQQTQLTINAEKDAQRKIPPSKMFLTFTDRFSQFDSSGFPTHDIIGTELTKSARKKLIKQYNTQEKKYRDYLKTLEDLSGY